MTYFEQLVTFTALPNGINSDGQLKVSVHIAPRLSSNAESLSLQQFLDFTNFASEQIGFTLVLGSGQKLATSPDPTPPVIVANNSLWTTIFPPSTPVVSYTLDSIDTFSDRLIRSYPAANVAQFTSNLYTIIGLSNPTGHPTGSTLLSKTGLGQIATDPAIRSDTHLGPLAGLLANLDTELKSNGGVLPPVAYDPANIGSDLAQVYKFHEPPPVPGTIEPTPIPAFDFHQGLGALGSHPQLLRNLGIIRDLVVTVPSGVSLGHTGTIQVVPIWSPQFAIFTGTGAPPTYYTRIVSPRAVYNTDYGFITQPTYASPKLDRRRLRLSSPTYSVIDYDVDGAALKAINLANALAHAADNSSASTPSTYALPAMRTEGLVLLETGLAATTQADLQRQQTAHEQINSGETPIFFAEHVLRGFHLDVLDTFTNQWRPLCARRVTYNSVNDDGSIGPSVVVEDEGIVTLGVTSFVPTSANPTPDIRIPETLAKWAGWSVVVPRIGSSLDGIDNSLQGPYDPTAPNASNPGNAAPATATNIHLGITTNVTQTQALLPSLRFGRTYQFRARAVDIAGNADPFSTSDSSGEITAPYQFSRYEPINPPVILLHDATVHPTESVHRLVIRSNYNTTSGEQSIRHLAQPNAGQLLVEHSGSLDTANGQVDGSLWPYLAALDGQKFDTSPLNTSIPDPQAPPPTSDTTAGGLIFTDDYVITPYLTDTFSRGAAAFGLPFGLTKVGGVAIPGGSAQLDWFYAEQSVSFAYRGELVRGSYPLSQGNRIRLVEGTTSDYAATVSQNSAGNSELLVPLTKGSVVTVQLSSYMTPDASGAPSIDIDRLGLWKLLEKGTNGAGLSSSAYAELRALIAAGLHPMFTPATQITLVHAVQQPLLEPVFMTGTYTRMNPSGILVKGIYSQFDSSRNVGETVAYLAGSFQVSGRSTSEVHVAASWNEQQDNLSQPGPTNPGYQAQPFKVKLDPSIYPIADSSGVPLAVAANEVDISVTQDPSTLLFSGAYSQDFHDHKHRMVNYTLEALSSFAEEFVQTLQLSVPFTSGSPSLVLGTNALIPGYNRIVDQSSGQVFHEGTDFLINSPGPGAITVVAPGLFTTDTLVITYLEGPVSRFSTESGDDTSSAQQTAVVNVPATARPAAPLIEYVIPAYLWGNAGKTAEPWQAVNNTTSTNTRTGNILRVYLARPWYSSGDNEQLAVVLPGDPAQPDAQDVTNYHVKTSLIGADPIWGTSSWQPEDVKYKPSGPVQPVLATSNFPLATMTATQVGLAEDALASVAVHEVAYDGDRQLWYSDIEITPKAGSYTPFVKLALARWQSSAVNDGNTDCRISTVATAEISQLTPTRVMTAVTNSSGGVTVTITGPSYQSTGQVGFYLAESAEEYYGALPGPSVITCQVQTVILGMDPEAFPDTAWQTVSTQTMVGSITTAGEATWKLTPTLPGRIGSQQMRLVFVEKEKVNALSTSSSGRVTFVATHVLRTHLS